MTTRIAIIVMAGILLAAPIFVNLLFSSFSSDITIILVSTLFLIVLITAVAAVIAGILEDILKVSLQRVKSRKSDLQEISSD